MYQTLSTTHTGYILLEFLCYYYWPPNEIMTLWETLKFALSQKLQTGYCRPVMTTDVTELVSVELQQS